MRAPAAAVHAGTAYGGSDIGRRMRSWVALKIVASTGMLAWLAALVANRALASLDMMAFLIVLSLPYLFALVIALAKEEFAGAVLVAAVVGLVLQLCAEVYLYATPPDGQKGFAIFWVLVAQVLSVTIAAAWAEALESHRRNKIERAMSDRSR